MSDVSASKSNETNNSIRVDIVSDVVCPWCIVGYRQFEKAAANIDVDLDIHWHPFELNPGMPAEGQDLREHIMQKYGSSQEESDANRQRLKEIGESLDFSFNYSDDSRMQNTFRAHQLLHWAEAFGKKHALKQAFFQAYFTDQRDINDVTVLVETAESVGLDRAETEAVIADGRFADTVREIEKQWTSRGISGVPAMVFEQKYLVTGAQGEENYTRILTQLLEEKQS